MGPWPRLSSHLCWTFIQIKPEVFEQRCFKVGLMKRSLRGSKPMRAPFMDKDLRQWNDRP